MINDYFKKVHSLTGTKFWINNVTHEEARLAIEAGAVGCTQNPSYTWRIINDPVEGQHAKDLIDQAIQETTDNNEVECIVQRKLIKEVSDLFLPLWQSSRGLYGYVSIQGDPINEEDADVIISEGRKNRELNPNIMIKIPATKAGIEAMDILISENTPINATEVMGIGQALEICEMYRKITLKTGNKPPIYYSLITGIYDEYLAKQIEKDGIQIDKSIVYMSGMIIAKKVYNITKAHYPEVGFIGGGMRGLQHFTEMVGADVCITMNWKGHAEELLRQDNPVVPRFFNPVPEKYLDALISQVPDFCKAYFENGLSVYEFEHYGPVAYFRDMFVNSWNNAIGYIEKRRMETV
jgi:transaldolase